MEINQNLRATLLCLLRSIRNGCSTRRAHLSALLNGTTIDLENVPLNVMNITLISSPASAIWTDRSDWFDLLAWVQTRFKLISDELKLWLGIIHFKLREIYQLPKEFLTSTAGNSTIENAPGLYMVVSHVAYNENAG